MRAPYQFSRRQKKTCYITVEVVGVAALRFGGVFPFLWGHSRVGIYPDRNSRLEDFEVMNESGVVRHRVNILSGLCKSDFPYHASGGCG